MMQTYHQWASCFINNILFGTQPHPSVDNAYGSSPAMVIPGLGEGNGTSWVKAGSGG
jgi:hypothetical protein